MSSTVKVIALIATAVTLTLATTSLILMWTFQEWPAPLQPVAYHGVVVFLLFLVGGVLWVMASREPAVQADGEAEARSYQRLVGLVAGVLTGLCALAITGVWAVPQARALYISTSTSGVQLERALGDQSAVVRLAACERVFEQGWAFRSQRALVAALDAHPGVAARCLEVARENGWIGTHALASDLRDGWERAILMADDATQACDLVAWTPVVDVYADRNPSVTLLECALSAESPDVRRCCAQTLVAGRSFVDAVGAPGEFPVEIGARLYAQLTLHAFFPTMLPQRYQGTASALGSTTSAVRDWTIELGCSLIDPQQTQTNVMRGFTALLENGSCSEIASNADALMTPAVLLRACGHTQTRADGAAASMSERLCDAMEDVQVDLTIDTARFAVYGAMRAMARQRDAMLIDRAVSAAQFYEVVSTDELFDREQGQWESALGTVPGLTPDDQRTCRTLRMNAQGQMGVVNDSTNCHRASRGLTAGEYRRRQKAAAEPQSPYADPEVRRTLRRHGMTESDARRLVSADSKAQKR